MTNRERIARKIAQDFRPDDGLINFGHGIPYSVPQYIDKSYRLSMLNEPGVIACGVCPPAEKGSPGERDMRDAMNRFCSANEGGSFFDTVFSFSLIRGGHVNKSVLGGLQVDEAGSLANYAIPGQPITGIGGAMDLCTGAREVLVAIETTAKDGSPKIVKQCNYPITGVGCVDRIYTEVGVFTVEAGKGLTLIECFPDYEIEQIRKMVEPDFLVTPELKMIDLGVPLS